MTIDFKADGSNAPVVWTASPPAPTMGIELIVAHQALAARSATTSTATAILKLDSDLMGLQLIEFSRSLAAAASEFRANFRRPILRATWARGGPRVRVLPSRCSDRNAQRSGSDNPMCGSQERSPPFFVFASIFLR